MTGLLYAKAVEGYGADHQDCAVVIEAGTALVVAVADGAGGTSHGGRAADHVIRGLGAVATPRLADWDGDAWGAFLRGIDRAIAEDPKPGQTTAVVLVLTPRTLIGASVGDSEAWLVAPGGVHDLTCRQRRKPLLGSGRADPVPFRLDHAGGTLLVGSDGLFKYAPLRQLLDLATRGQPERASESLVDLVRLPGGQLQDDVAVVVCRCPGESLAERT